MPQAQYNNEGPRSLDAQRRIPLAPMNQVVMLTGYVLKLAVQGQYMPVYPDVFGQKWDLQFAITPIIPKLISRNVLEGW